MGIKITKDIIKIIGYTNPNNHHIICKKCGNKRKIISHKVDNVVYLAYQCLSCKTVVVWY